VLVVAVGKRERNAVYKAAAKRSVLPKNQDCRGLTGMLQA